MLLTELARGLERSDAVRFEGHPAHRHEEPQLVHVVVGRAVVTAGGEHLPVAEGEGVWLPGGVEHAVHLEPGGVLAGPLLSAPCSPPDGTPRVVSDPAVHRLVVTLLGVGPDTDEHIGVFRSALERILGTVGSGYFPLRLPTHPAARAIADDAVRCRASLEQLAEAQFVSVRHAQRLFLEQTGLPFATWRSRARLNAAITRLHGGHGVRAALAASGYRTREGLAKALQRECGTTLGELLAAQPGTGLRPASPE